MTFWFSVENKHFVFSLFNWQKDSSEVVMIDEWDDVLLYGESFNVYC